MGLFKSLFGSPTPSVAPVSVKEMSEILADSISDAYSSSRFIEQFGDHAFSEEWSSRDGLAVWYSFGMVSLDAAVWTSVGSPKQANLILEACDPLISKRWKMSDEVLARFNAVRAKTSKEAFLAYVDCQSGEDQEAYAFRCVNWILGAELPFDDKSKSIELMLKGYQPKAFDPFAQAAFSHYFNAITTATKKMLSSVKIAWPNAAC